MVRVLVLFFLMAFGLGACSRADHQSVGSQVPAPGLNHLVQVYVVADQENAGPLALNFLASFGSSLPNAKLYVARPANAINAETALREWSARQMDWLFVSGKASVDAFLKAKISWSNTKKVVLIREISTSTTLPNFDERVVVLNYAPGLLSRWSQGFCAEHIKAPECANIQKPQIFEWSHSAEDSPQSRVDVAWMWPGFLRELESGRAKRVYEVSFRDGFLTLTKRTKVIPDVAASARLDQWIRNKALAGLKNE